MALSIRINPAVLKWVMDNEGWNADELAGESGLSASQIQLWASIESDISIKDLRKMSGNFRRPMSVLFMSEAPETAVPRFRRNDGMDGASPRPSRDMLNVIREARYVQDNAAELLRSMGKNEHSGMPRATREQSPELAAAKCAADLGIEPPRRAGSGEGRDGQRYSEIRERIESQSVFTMQAAIPAEDRVSGFALVKPPPAVILVNSRDRIRRRIFTLLHEYAHAVLNDADVACAVGDVRVGGGGGGGADGRHDSGMPDAEQWCDRFAGAVLMPREKFLGALRDVREEEGDGDPLRVVTVLSDKFCVTKTAALTRTVEVLDGDNVTAAYSRCRVQAGQGGPVRDNDGKGGIRAPRAAVCMARRGRGYARLVLGARESGIITTSAVLEYIGIKLKHLDDLRARCGAR